MSQTTSVLNDLSQSAKWSSVLLLLAYFFLLPFSTSFLYPALLFAFYSVYVIFIKLRGNDKQVYVKYVVCGMLIIIPGYLASLDAINFSESLRKAGSLTLYLACGIGILNVTLHREIQDKFILGLGIVLTVWVFDAIYQYVCGANILGYEYINGRLTGIFYPHNRIGVVLSILSGFYFEFLRRTASRSSLYWLLVIPYALVILLGASRSSWFMAVLSIVLYVFLLMRSGSVNLPSMKNTLISIFIVCFVSITFVTYKPQSFVNTLDFLERRVVDIQYVLDGNLRKSGAIYHRVQIWESALRISVDHPVNGIGIRGFRYSDIDQIKNSGYEFLTDEPVLNTHPHLIILEIMTETGFIGLLSYLVLFYLLVRTYCRLAADRTRAHVAFWSIPAIVATFPLNMHKSFYGSFSSLLIWVLLTLAFSGCYKAYLDLQQTNKVSGGIT